MNKLEKIVKEEDKIFAHNLTRDNMSHYVKKYWGGWSESIFWENYQQRTNLLIFSNEEKIGYLGYIEFEKFIRLEDIQINTSLQGKGIGSWAINELEKIALGKKKKYIELRVFYENRAKELYARLGFTVESEEENTCIMRKIQNNALHQTPTGGAGELKRSTNIK